MTLLAVGDESMRQRHDGSGIYVIAAPFFDQAHIADLRAEAASLSRAKHGFHWRQEEPQDRRRAVQMLTRLEALHFAVVGIGLDNPRQERGRRQVLRALLWHLQSLSVSELWLDARRPNQNMGDIFFFDTLRIRGEIRDDLRIEFAQSKQEPLLWLADIVAGAVSSAWGDGDYQYVRPLDGILDVREIQLH